eukprot:CAMPEP_0119024298 /NCGR_PEP_ID=MMETSP1176-20130426/31608_1 /TAXON_ID=265551 /ORGANISM="Synedropsis recta cf, Strain CCMP1620" /LENGTH=47 /DNA_ID= /DNA_START= /DNA_END= /DNA_ORIENTATION=
MRKCTNGAMDAPSRSWWGPVKMADGTISPNKRIKVVDRRIATQPGTN